MSIKDNESDYYVCTDSTLEDEQPSSKSTEVYNVVSVSKGITSFNEAGFEYAVIDLFRSQLHYRYLHASDLKRDNYASPLLLPELQTSLQRINPRLPQAAIDAAVSYINTLDATHLVQQNFMFTDYLQNGISVTIVEQGKNQSFLVKLLDRGTPENNSFICTNQYLVEGYCKRCIDIVLLINGLPLVVMELKSPSRLETDLSHAFNQIRCYIQDVPNLFVYNQVCVISDHTFSKAGTITAQENKYREWKSIDGAYSNLSHVAFNIFFEGLFAKSRLIDIFCNFICFSGEGANLCKILASYHQFFAVRKSIESIKQATESNGKGGVFWHTQGSGKSMSMVFLTHLLLQEFQSPTILVVTDRNSLDNQLFNTFSQCRMFLRQDPVQAESRSNLRDLLSNRMVNGIIFTTVQKFDSFDEVLTERRDVIVLVDEAHRTQYSLSKQNLLVKDADNNIDFKLYVGLPRRMRDALPKATFVGFTGTPINESGRCTVGVFGDVIDGYDFRQANLDGVICNIEYENRMMNLHLQQSYKEMLDSCIDDIGKKMDHDSFEIGKRIYSQLDVVLGNDSTIDAFTHDVVKHYLLNRANVLTGKAMIVVVSRSVAIKVYQRLLQIKPEWSEMVKVVITPYNNDPLEWRKIIGNNEYRANLASQFKDDNSSFKIAIVVDMWLTGFDVPSLATMYIYKPMERHNLMQAIARVNRTYPGKQYGLIVDYIGLAKEIKDAFSEYSFHDCAQCLVDKQSIEQVAYLSFQNSLSVCKGIFAEFDYSYFNTDDNLAKAKLINDGLDFLLSKSVGLSSSNKNDSVKVIFLRNIYDAKNREIYCSHYLTEQERFDLAYFDLVKVALVRLSNDENGHGLDLSDIKNRVYQLLPNAIKTTATSSLVSDDTSSFSLFDPDLLKGILELNGRHLAVEALRFLIGNQLYFLNNQSVMYTEKYSALLKQTVDRYTEGRQSNEITIKDLVLLSQKLAKLNEKTSSLGLTMEEMGIYGALTQAYDVTNLLSQDELIALTKQLTEDLHKNLSIDWYIKESVRASIRCLVKRILNRFNYPKDGLEQAIKLIFKHIELFSIRNSHKK